MFRNIFLTGIVIVAIINFNKVEFLKKKITFYFTIQFMSSYILPSLIWTLLNMATYSFKKRVGTWPDRYHLKREAISITISERIGTRVVIEYGLSAQKWKLLQEPCTV